MAALPWPGAEVVSLPRMVWFHLQHLPLLPDWFRADEEGTAPQFGENVELGEQSATACFGFACLAVQVGLP